MSHFRRIAGVLLLWLFLLGNHKGYLALWKDGGREPFQIFPVKVDSLPESDRQRLDDGIQARSDLELAALLEDYLS